MLMLLSSPIRCALHTFALVYLILGSSFSYATEPPSQFDLCESLLRNPMSAEVSARFMKPFDLNRFKEGSPLTMIGSIEDKATFSADHNINVQDMVIKMPGTEVRIPGGYAQFSEAIEKIFAFEQANNPNLRDYYAYITVKQRTVGDNQAQRRPGVHADGFPESLTEEHTSIAHTYVLTDNNPTVLYPHAFDFSKANKEQDILPLMEEQKDESLAIRGEPYQIIYMDPYTVHRSPEFAPNSNARRTFFRTIFSRRQHNRMGNGHNPLFDYDWMMYPRGSSRAPLYTLKGVDGSGQAATPARVGTAEAERKR